MICYRRVLVRIYEVCLKKTNTTSNRLNRSNSSFIFVESESCSVVSNSLWPHGLYRPWNSLGQNTGVGSLSLLQRIFLTQESNRGLLNCRWILYQLRYQRSPYFYWILYFESGYVFYLLTFWCNILKLVFSSIPHLFIFNLLVKLCFLLMQDVINNWRYFIMLAIQIL